jgi:hypothetical protein
MVNDPLRIERLKARIVELEEEEVAGLRERLGEADPGHYRAGNEIAAQRRVGETKQCPA